MSSSSTLKSSALGAFAASVIASASMTVGAASAQSIPNRPEDIHFPSLSFEPPNAVDHRFTTGSGVTVYAMPSREFPLVTVTFSFKGGEYLVPANKAGLAAMTGAMMRQGGTTNIAADDLDEQLDFLAAQVNVFAGDDSAAATINTLKSNLDEAFALFMDMVRNPGFDVKKFAIRRDEVIENMKQRNDDASRILSREWGALLYGRDSYTARVPTIDAINSITVEDMQKFHDGVFNPANLIVGVTGDFNVDDMLKRLDDAFAGWETGAPNPDPPAPQASVASGVYHIEKDIPQGKVNIGHRSVRRDDPDAIAMQVMNGVLGGSGFTSRITKRVRSDEGLAYSAGSRLSEPYYYPGEFRAFFQSKNPTVALAIQIILEEISLIRAEPVTDEELSTIKNSMIETFPRRFESKQAVVGTFINDDRTHRPEDYWRTYRDKVRALTAADLQRVAKAHLHPEDLVVLIVGKQSEIAPGDLEGRSSLAKVVQLLGGKTTELPLRDPLTQKPIKN